MKKIINSFLLASFLVFVPEILSAQEIQIEGTKFIQPIIEKWVVEYKKENPDSRINVKTVQNKAENTGLQIIADAVSNGNGKDSRVVYVGRYALIPISNPKNPLLEKANKGLKKKDLIDLIFEKDILDDDFDPDEKAKYTATVYTRGNEASTAITLAEYFKQSPERIKGKKIFGDEIYLLNAIKKDETGITFNTLNYVYDLNSRHLKSDICLLPLNLKSKQKEILESQDIDKVISLLEEAKIETIPVENFGLQIPAEYAGDKDLADFINWILEHGQRFNHEYGFLTLDNETFTSQKIQLDKQNKEYLSYSNK